MTDALEGLRKVLALERSKRYSNTAVVGGLDAYLQRFVSDNQLPISHPIARILRDLPGGGYRELHPITRRRVVERLLAAAEASPRLVAAKNLTRLEERDGAHVNGPRGLAGGPGLPASRAVSPRASGRRPVTVIGTLVSPVTVLNGVTKSFAEKLARPSIGIQTVRDLLYLLPHSYEEYLGPRPLDRVEMDRLQTVTGEVWSAGGKIAGRRKVTEAVVSGQGGSIRVVFWSGPWMAKRLPQGRRVSLLGKVTAFRGRLQMENPEFVDTLEEMIARPAIWGVYHGTEGLKQTDLRRVIRGALETFADGIEETLPEDLVRRHSLLPPGEALQQVHFPDSMVRAEDARRRFVFEELLHIELGVVSRRREWQAGGEAPRLQLSAGALDGFVQSLPFALTTAQRRAMAEVFADLSRDAPMSRLVEGDVGAGKTVVAAAALLAAVECGYQGAIMAPTEILAEQHFRTFRSILAGETSPESIGNGVLDGDAQAYARLQPAYLDRPVRIALLKGSLSAERRRVAQEGILSGDVSIAIGTHALVQESVGFARLGLVVVDEQHRFGVEQRGALREKGQSPHMLVMTATPIPRTLALTVYGDLEITVVNEMPPGRPPVKTWRVTPQQRTHAYNFLRTKISEGRQAYVIFPLVEESEAVQARAAVQEFERLSKDVFPDLRLGLLHGRMPASEKDAVMRAFRDHELDVLVSTAVVEVGVDVPNATVIVIEGADRFGLAQLHQFRGRVRRSSEQAYCFLLSESMSSEAVERLQIMETTNDGFKLAEEDLRLRGPGEYFGTRQSGMPDLKAARLTDVGLIEEARAEATRILDDDPGLRWPEHEALRGAMERLWGRISAEAS